jgi:hypothetical protein
MRLLLTVGYHHLLFGKDANVTGIISALEGARNVEEKGYGSDRKYIVKGIGEQDEFDIKIIQDDAVSLPENESRQLNVIVKLEEEKSKANSDMYSAKYKLDEANKKIAELQSELDKLQPKKEAE